MKLGLLDSAEQSATTESGSRHSVLLVKQGLLGPEQRAGAAATAATAAVKSAGEARHPSIAKQSATTEPELVERCGEWQQCRR